MDPFRSIQTSCVGAGQFRTNASVPSDPSVGLEPPAELRPLLGVAAAERTEEQKRKLDAWFRPLAPSLDAARDRVRAIQNELDDMKVVTTLVMQERAGFERHVCLHALRHTACSAVYALSKDLRLTQRFARHRSVVTTMVYTHPSDDDLVRAVEQLRC